MLTAVAGAADRQIRPFFGATFGGGTTFVHLDSGVGKPHVTVGANVAVIGEIVGIDVDFGHSPGFFQTGDGSLVLGSSVTTVTGNVIIAAPRRLTEYVLRPYLVGGAGIMRVHRDDYLNVFEIAEVLPAIDFGGGVVGFLTNRVGVSWEIRRFQTIGNRDRGSGISFGPESLSFWRGSMALVVRF
jgi:hypothetical protein